MDIPTPDSVTIYPRGTEGPYGPAYGAGVTSAACAQEVITRTVGTDGEIVLSDMLVLLPAGTAAEAGDALATAAAWYDVLAVERLAIGGAAHHVELLCKTRAEALARAEAAA